MCSGAFSHLIDQENKSINDQRFHENIPYDEHLKDGDSFHKVDFKTATRVYVAGGEPTVMPEFYKFLRNSINNNRTNFELNVNTNAVKISEPLFDMFKKFSRLWFTCSIDGTAKVNEYIRWGTDSIKQISNIHRLHKNGAGIHIIMVSSIYNIHDLGNTMQFFDNEFPYATVQVNYAGFKNDLLSPFNHPNTNLILESLKKAKSSKCYYHQERGSKPMIDSFIEHYSSNPTVDIDKLKKFFYYNDTLDEHRGAKLADYIPQLEECRKYV
jgi:sulfatase maturation enzyme AslB (radical SAM superfamily)